MNKTEALNVAAAALQQALQVRHILAAVYDAGWKDGRRTMTKCCHYSCECPCHTAEDAEEGT